MSRIPPLADHADERDSVGSLHKFVQRERVRQGRFGGAGGYQSITTPKQTARAPLWDI